MHQQIAEKIRSSVCVAFFFFMRWNNKATPQQLGTKPICYFDTCVTSGVAGGRRGCVCLCVMVGLIVCFHTHLLWILWMPFMHLPSIWLYMESVLVAFECLMCVACVFLHVWIHEQCQVLLCLKQCWWQVFADLPGLVRFSGCTGVRAWTPSSMTKRHSFNILGQRVSELALNDFLRASQPSALCYHVTMWPSKQTNQSTAEENMDRAASSDSHIHPLIVLAYRQALNGRGNKNAS